MGELCQEYLNKYVFNGDGISKSVHFRCMFYWCIVLSSYVFVFSLTNSVQVQGGQDYFFCERNGYNSKTKPFRPIVGKAKMRLRTKHFLWQICILKFESVPLDLDPLLTCNEFLAEINNVLICHGNNRWRSKLSKCIKEVNC